MSAAPTFLLAPRGSLLDLVLDEQATLTAVERFARQHEAGELEARGARYRALLPSARPAAGEQYAFEVDLDACTGCKACVAACHSLNGLEEGETWRRVGLLVGADAAAPALQTVTGACHHCEDPGCLSGCPVGAYVKDAGTGIVRHLDDQCIGCQYCTLTCPYEVPQYSERLGIVRKCDLCTGRLSAGEAPACVQGCPNDAIGIRLVPRETVPRETAPRETRPSAGAAALLPVAAGALRASTHTRPTTRYVGRAASAASLRPADQHELRPAKPHWPLVVLLVATQLSVGLVAGEVVARAAAAPAAPRAAWLVLALVAALAGQASSLLHLGRPQLAFRAVLGLRTSWMSREALVLALYSAALACYTALALFASPEAGTLLGVATAALGALGVFAQVMIYAVTGRPAWSRPRTALRFAGSVLVLGAAAALATCVVLSHARASAGAFVAVLLLAAACKLAAEWRLRHADLASPVAALVRGARLEAGPLRRRAQLRAVALAGGVALLVAAAAFAATPAGAGLAALVALAGAGACLAGEVAERHLFFVAESARGMPGA